MNNSTVSCQGKCYRSIVCFESVDGEVQRRSEGATLCVCGWRKHMTRCQEKRCGIKWQRNM